jgi:BASS family bile acid:Na+ symporter
MIDDTLHVVAQVGVLAGVFTAMLGIGASVPIGEILASLRDARTLLLALAANFVAVPLLALLLVNVLPLTGEGRAALLLLGATAGAPILPKLAHLADGHVPFSIGLMVLLMIITVAYAPLVLPLLLADVSVAPAEIARSLVALMLLPLAVGLLARARYPRVAGWPSELGRVSATALAIGLAAGLLVGWKGLLAELGSGIVIGAALLTLGAAGIGWAVAAGADAPKRRVAALGTGMRNFSAALLVAGTDLGKETLVMTMAATLTLMIVLFVIAGEMGRLGSPAGEAMRRREEDGAIMRT